jgi:peptide deformylase
MAILKIARLGHPVLLGRAEPVGRGGPELDRLIDDMVETLIDSGGIGLAAPQVHVPLRVILVRIGEEREDARAAAPEALIDPELEVLGDELGHGIEGCLSIPGLQGVVPRLERVRFRARDREGRPVAGVARGLHARVLQHEVDHLDGILYPVRMDDLRLLAFEGEMPRLRAWLAEAGPPEGEER